MRISKIKWKRKKTLDVLQCTTVWYLFWESSNSAKLYQNTPVGSTVNRLQGLTC